MRSQRKDEHVYYALRNQQGVSDFETMHFIHNSLPDLSYDAITTKASYLHHVFAYPVYINAMTGGSEKTGAINRRLASLAKRFDLVMSVGSQHAALDQDNLRASFSVVREENPHGFIIGNVSANATLEQAQQAVAMIDANALGIHINAAQEIAMDEGDRDFSRWKENIKTIVDHVGVPVIVKEVGSGMSAATVQALKDLGVQHVDVSGRGGTNFVWIEQERSQDKRFDYLTNWGISTLESVLMNRAHMDDIEVFASGGVSNALDVIKLLALGVKAVGISGMFLKLSQLEEADMFKQTDDFLKDIRKLMLLLGAKDIAALGACDFYLEGRLASYYEIK